MASQLLSALLSLKKPFAIIIAVEILILALLLFIIPSQGGLTSSTELQSGAIESADPKYQEQIPIQEVDLSSSGRSIFIAFVMLSHVLFANLQLGGSWVAVGTESVYLRKKKNSEEGAERYKRIARSITLFNVIVFSTGATLAIAGVLFFISLYPAFASYAFHIYWWPLLIEAFTFAFEIFFLYTYWFSWDKISARWHQVLGYAFAVDVFIQTLMINTLASGMLTPGSSTIVFSGSAGISIMPDYLSWWFNATTIPLQFHRLFASIAFFGFVLAMLSVLHFLDRKDASSKRYWDWVGSYGIGIGILGLIAQPFLGFFYMSDIMRGSPLAFEYIMHGPRAWEMLLMVGLLSLLFISCIAYFIDRREVILARMPTKRVRTLLYALLAIAVVFALVLVQPSWLGGTSRYDPAAWVNPIGYMRWFKYVSLFGLVGVGIALFIVDFIALRKEKEGEWGNLTVPSRLLATLIGIFGMWIVIVMGFVRESARSPWTIFNIIPVPGGQSYPTPIPAGQMFVVWAIIIALTFAIFWFVSKVTAEHPEQAERM